VSRADYYFREGERDPYCYEEAILLEMLKSDDIFEVYEAMEAIGKRKLKSALESLKYIALYNDDLGLQEIAIRTIRRIGGRKAIEILRLLKTTEHRDLIEKIIKYGADYGW
jgi:HEAT repeat protein